MGRIILRTTHVLANVMLRSDRIWGIWGSYYNIPKAIFYLLKGDYILYYIHTRNLGPAVLVSRALTLHPES